MHQDANGHIGACSHARVLKANCCRLQHAVHGVCIETSAVSLFSRGFMLEDVSSVILSSIFHLDRLFKEEGMIVGLERFCWANSCVLILPVKMQLNAIHVGARSI